MNQKKYPPHGGYPTQPHTTPRNPQPIQGGIVLMDVVSKETGDIDLMILISTPQGEEPVGVLNPKQADELGTLLNAWAAHGHKDPKRIEGAYRNLLAQFRKVGALDKIVELQKLAERKGVDIKDKPSD